MEMREGFMRPPRNRGGMMWPLVPLRGRNMMGMDRMRLPPLRPGLMRGGPPPPFVGRGMTPPHARPRGMGPVMLPRPPIHPPGPMGPLGPRGMLHRPMLPPRPHGLDAVNPNESAQIPINGAMKEPLKNLKDSNIPKNVPGPGSNLIGNRMVNRNIKVHNRAKGNQNTGQSPLQSMHSASHHPQPPPPVQQNSAMNPSHIPKHVHPIQSQMNAGGVPQQTQPHPMQHQPALRGGRNGLNPRNRGAAGMGRGGLMNIPQMGGGVGNRGNAMMNRGGPPNISPRGGPPVPHGRGNMMGGLPPPAVPYSSAPPPPQSSYPVPPPVMGSQVPVKRGGPPMGMPPPMPPKRVRYDTPLPANGYGQYQQQPPPQTSYSPYDAPPPTDMYNNAPPPPMNASQSQSYNSSDYNYPSGPQNSSYSVNTPYSSYNDPGYSSYSGGSSAYDPSVEYHSSSNSQSMNNTSADPYGYKAAAPIDSYGSYSNSNYSNSQAGYDDYSSGYMDGSGYGASVQDSSYGQSVGTYNNYSY